MIDIWNEIQHLLGITPFVLLCMSSSKCNLKKSRRNRQFLMPLVALIYGIVASISSVRINNMVLDFIDSIPSWVSFFSTDASVISESVLGYVEWTYIAFYISNALIVAFYIIIKKSAVSIMNRAFKNHNSLLIKATDRIYSYHSDKDVWTVRDNLGDTRLYLKYFYYVTVIWSSMLFVISRNLMSRDLIVSPFFPVIGVIIIGEMYFLLDGFIWSEYLSVILGENEESVKIVNYSVARKYLRRLFRDKISAENTTINSDYINVMTNEEVIRKLEMDSDVKIRNYGTYIRGYYRLGKSIDQSYVESAKSLLKGNSIFFNNPFYKDLTPYIFYPINQIIMHHKKVLFVLGRHSIEQDIEEWIRRGISMVTSIPNLWRVGILDDSKPDFEIGIISRSDVHNLNMHKSNEEFFKDVYFVVIIEPSKLINTAQIGLAALIKSCHRDDKKIVYCTCDKNCDGLVDALSHILMTSITEVSATNKHLGTSSYMCFSADSEYWHHRMLPSISRYLGIGTELCFVALRNQITSTYWFGGEAYPVIDQKWISSQYYYGLLDYAGLTPKQNNMDRHFSATQNFWSAKIEPNLFMVVEDEPNNLFEIVRDFSTRAEDQGFVNVISSDYLLKDYMSYNYTIFESDPKAIPYIVADYARTIRNVTLRLILMMSINSVDEDFIRKEYSLAGENIGDVKKYLWDKIVFCYESNSVLKDLSPQQIYNYRILKNGFDAPVNERGEENSYGAEIINETVKYNVEGEKENNCYSIVNYDFIAEKISELKCEKYIAEDEDENRHFLGSELVGHIYQKYLPGQLFTFDGKYYEMMGVSGKGQMLVRRAADHIFNRYTYRQIRRYQINNRIQSEQIGDEREIGGVKFYRENADITVETDAYLRMSKYNDFNTAVKVSINGIPSRVYNNKQYLRISLPDIDNNPKIKYTLAALLNEVFRTLFAENQCFIVALTDDSFLKDAEINKINTYTLSSSEIDKDSIYIIEDSQLDLGLLVAVERHFNRILNIISDYLCWNKQTIYDSRNNKIRNNVFLTLENVTADREPQKKKNVFQRVIDKITEFTEKIKERLRKRRASQIAKFTGADDVEKDSSEKEASNSTDESKLVNQIENGLNEMSFSTLSNEDSEDGKANGQNAEKKEVNPKSYAGRRLSVLSKTIQKDISEKSFHGKPYHLRYYLLYGYENEDILSDQLATNETLEYLENLSSDNNSLRQARENMDVAQKIENEYPHINKTHICSFCGVELVGTEYEILSDGRERCMNCGNTAVKDVEEFTQIFREVLRNLESFFEIKINTGIRVEVTNSKKIAKISGYKKSRFVKLDTRPLGFAADESDGYKIYIESGLPRIRAMMTIAHELTRIWQFINWDMNAMRKKYKAKNELLICEGMAAWVEIQYAMLINEKAFAKRSELILSERNDDYGRGFRLFQSQYPFTNKSFIENTTPFSDKNNPIKEYRKIKLNRKASSLRRKK